MGRDIQHGLNFPLLRELVYDLGADYIGMAHDCLIPFRVELLLDPHHTGRCNAGHRQGYDRLSLRHLHGCLRLRHADDSAAAGGEHRDGNGIQAADICNGGNHRNVAVSDIVVELRASAGYGRYHDLRKADRQALHGGRGDCSALCAADGQNALNPPFVMQPAKRFLQTFAHLVLCCGLSLLRQIGAAVADACLCKHGIPCKIRRDGRGGAHTGVDQQYGAAHLLNRLL